MKILRLYKKNKKPFLIIIKWLSIFLNVILVIITVLYLLIQFLIHEGNLNPSPPDEDEVMYERYCYYLDDTIVYDVTGFVEVPISTNSSSKSFLITGGRKVKVIKFTQDSVYAEIWADEGRAGTFRGYVLSKHLYPKLPPRMREDPPKMQIRE